MSTRRWSRYVRGRKRRAKLCLPNNAVKVKPSLKKRLRELQGAVPGSEGMDMQTFSKTFNNTYFNLKLKSQS
ncbi:hypothetical protein ACSQ67_006678 [Phaseolus vulgaris]